jgi:hypothetical protein
MASTALKIGFGCVALVVLVVLLAAGGGVYWWRQHGRELIEGMQQTVEQGEEFGRGADEQGCVNEAVARIKGDNSMTGGIKVRIFLEGCLRTSRPVPAGDFCAGVPRQTEFSRTAAWRRERCQEAGSSGPFCEQIFEAVQVHCASGRADRPAPSASPGLVGNDNAAPPPPTPRRRRT